MIIAVNTRFSGDGQQEEYENFMFECLSRITNKYPQHQFIYIFNKPFDNHLIFAKNVTAILAGPETKNTLLFQYWLNYKIPALLRKYKADVFISVDGVCSLRTKTPQCLIIDDLSFLWHSHFLKKHLARFYKKFTPKFLAKAKSIVTLSEFSKSVIVDRYKIPADKVDVLHTAIDEIFKPIDQSEKEMIKKDYTEGKEYFLFSGNINHQNNLINLLKAFSFFKKRQKSNMFLLIAGKSEETFSNELKSYKFRNEVKVLDNLSTKELAKITAAAYALVYPVLYKDYAIAPLQAMQCNIPVVSSNTGALPSICGEAALYVNPEDFKDIAEKMMLVFKDENKVKELVSAGKIQIQQYQYKKTSDLLWQSILKAINK